MLIDAYDAFAIDLDGVVWRGSDPIPGASAGVAAIREAAKPLVFLTNNALVPPELVAERLQTAGIEADVDEIVTSVAATRSWITEAGLAGADAFVLGDESVEEQFSDLVKVTIVEQHKNPALVLVARDSRFTFERLHAASQAARRGAHLLAVNRDPVLPVPGGFEPGTGALVAAIETASGKKAIVIGKPELPMMREAARRLGSDKVLMIGDQPSSDVLGAKRVGWDSVIVLTGVSAPDDLLDPAPNYVMASLRSITDDVKPIAPAAADGAPS